MLMRNGLTAYLVSTAFVAVGVLLGVHLLKPSEGAHSVRRVAPNGNVYIDAMSRWDGQWLLQIATEGYTYDPDGQSSVAVYPLYPFLVGLASRMASLPADITGLLVSHTMFLGALTLLIAYVRTACGACGARPHPGLAPKGEEIAFSGARTEEIPVYATIRPSCHPGRLDWVPHAALACALFPTSFFMRMVYTESLFLFLSLLTFVAMQRKWPLVSIAFIAGLATATRSVGVALAAAVMWHVWERSRSRRTALARLTYLAPLAIWGIAAYAIFQWWIFGDPFAFVKTQQHWYLRAGLPRRTAFGALLMGTDMVRLHAFATGLLGGL